jgi:hypothetical protein
MDNVHTAWYNKPLPQNILDHINKQTQEYFAQLNGEHLST